MELVFQQRRLYLLLLFSHQPVQELNIIYWFEMMKEKTCLPNIDYETVAANSAPHPGFFF